MEEIYRGYDIWFSDEGVSTINNIMSGHRMNTLLLHLNISQDDRFDLIGNI